MCTVTFIPSNGSFFLTSNRDEKIQRSQAVPPKVYVQNETQILYPKDADAGGTWIALTDNFTAGVLLNGAFVNHTPSPPYRLSRGLVLVEILAAPDPLNIFLQMCLQDIEPFTLILFQQLALHECRWDGSEKFSHQLTTGENHIWSSATLYNKAVQHKREQWFSTWLGKNNRPTQADIFQFHQFGGEGDEHNDIRMNREGKLFTVSITGIQLNCKTAVMNYLDLKDDATFSQKINHTSAYTL